MINDLCNHKQEINFARFSACILLLSFAPATLSINLNKQHVMRNSYLARFACASLQFYSLFHCVQCAFAFKFDFAAAAALVYYLVKAIFPTKLAEMPKDTPIPVQLLMCVCVGVGPLRQRARTRSKVVASRCHTHIHARTHKHLANFSFLCFFGIFAAATRRVVVVQRRKEKGTGKLVIANLGWKNALTVAVLCTLFVRQRIFTHTLVTRYFQTALLTRFSIAI